MNIAVSSPLVPLVDLREYSCHWPIGDPKDDDFGFCGAPSEAGKRYCARHCGLAYRPTERLVERRSSTVQIAARPTDHHSIVDHAPIRIWRPKKACAEAPIEVQPITLADANRAAKERQARFDAAGAELRAEKKRAREELRLAAQAKAEKEAEERREREAKFVAEYEAQKAKALEQYGWAEVPSPKIRCIIEVTGRHFGVTPLDIVSSRRTKAVVFPRHIAMYLARNMTTKSLPEISRQFGNRDHTSLIFAVQKIAALIEADGKIKSDIEAITAQIKTAVGRSLADQPAVLTDG